SSFFPRPAYPRPLHSFPTRRSSDLRAPDSGDDRSVAPNNETAAPAAADRSQAPSPSEPAAGWTERSEGSGAADIERLEASLRWLKNQSAELRRSNPDPLVLPRVLPSATWR